MRIRKRGWGLLITAAILIAAGRYAGLFEVFVLGAATAVLVAVCLVWVWARRIRLDGLRSLRPAILHAGSAAVVTIDVHNDGRWRSPVLRLVDPVGTGAGAAVLIAPVAADGDTQTAYRIPTTRRGLVELGPLHAVHADPFGVAERRTTIAPISTLTVLPRIDPVRPLGHTAAPDAAGRRRAATVARRGEDFAALRAYVVGDDLRRVHWPSSARTDDLLVRQDDVPWQDHVIVALDLRDVVYGADRFEQAVSAAASILVAHAERGDQVRLLTNGGGDLGGGDGRHVRRALEHLATVQSGVRAPLATMVRAVAAHRPGAVVVVTGTPASGDLDAIDRTLGRVPRRRVLAFSTASATASTATPGAAPVRGRTEILTVADTESFPAVWDTHTGDRRPTRPGRRPTTVRA